MFIYHLHRHEGLFSQTPQVNVNGYSFSTQVLCKVGPLLGRRVTPTYENRSVHIRGTIPGSSSIPIMECVLPAPVCPYAKMQLLNPPNACSRTPCLQCPRRMRGAWCMVCAMYYLRIAVTEGGKIDAASIYNFYIILGEYIFRKLCPENKTSSIQQSILHC